METRSKTAKKRRTDCDERDSQTLRQRTNEKTKGSNDDDTRILSQGLRVTRSTSAAIKRANTLGLGESLHSGGRGISTGSRLNYEIHPLKNPLILKSVFQFCSVKTLKTCRLVAAMWLKESFDSWREKAILHVRMTTKCRNPHQKLCFSDLMESQELEEGHQLKAKPFSKYKLKCRSFFCEPCYSEVLEWFFSNFHLSVKYLEIRFYRGTFHQLLNLISKCTAMSHFRISSCPLETYSDEEDEDESTCASLPPEYSQLERFEFFSVEMTKDDWMKLLSRTPNLKAISMEETVPRDLKAIFEVMKELKDSGKLLNLEELKYGEDDSLLFIDKFPLNVVKLIRTCSFPLNRMTINFGENSKPNAINTLLKAHAQTLTHFRGIFQSAWKDLMEWTVEGKFPALWNVPLRMEKLTEISFVNGPYWGFNILRGLQVPQLRRLAFEYDIWETEVRDLQFLATMQFNFHYDKLPEILLQGIVLPEVEHFHYETRIGHFSSRNVEALAKSMPNLKHLAMSLSSETFPTACRYWTGLKSLKILKGCREFEQLNDGAFTGLLPEEELSRAPNISDLKELIDFEIEQVEPSLTDFSVDNGFLQLPHLHYLRAPFKKLSAGARSALEEHVNFVEISN